MPFRAAQALAGRDRLRPLRVLSPMAATALVARRNPSFRAVSRLFVHILV
jgi:hypothetical protein